MQVINANKKLLVNEIENANKKEILAKRSKFGINEAGITNKLEKMYISLSKIDVGNILLMLSLLFYIFTTKIK